MTAEEIRRLQDEWLAARPSRPQQDEHPLVTLANEAHDALPEEAKLRLMRKTLKLTVSERFEQHKRRLELIFAHGAEFQTKEDFVRLLYPDL